jgi:hypothetical protein
MSAASMNRHRSRVRERIFPLVRVWQRECNAGPALPNVPSNDNLYSRTGELLFFVRDDKTFSSAKAGGSNNRSL